MGEAKRRKKIDPNYGKPPKYPIMTYLNESHPDYKQALLVKEKAYPDKSLVKLVRLDLEDGSHLVGAVWVFLNSSSDQLYTQAAWISSNPTENKVYHLPKHISRQIALDVKKEIEASQIVLRYES